MNQSTMVFRHANGVRTYPSHLNEVAAALEGETLASRNPGVWGTFLYARNLRQEFLALDTPYELVVRPQTGQLNFRLAGDEVYLPLHYLRLTGPHFDTVTFPLGWKDSLTGATCRLDAHFAYARTFRFIDMCKDRLAVFLLQNNRPVLEFRNRFSNVTEYLLPLGSEQ